MSLSERQAASYTRYFTRRAGQIGPQVGQVEAQWATEPQADPLVGHIYWGYPDTWPPTHWEEFRDTQDGWIVNTGWNSEDGTEFYELRTRQATMSIDGTGFDITVPQGPQRYVLAVIPRSPYTLVTNGEMWVRGGDKIGDYTHTQTWMPPNPIHNPLWYEGPASLFCLTLNETWRDSGGKQTQQTCDYAYGMGIGWRLYSPGVGTRYALAAWAY